jgi:hypothetical protein
LLVRKDIWGLRYNHPKGIAMTNPIQSILNIRPISRIRRNHGLEHATLTILAQRYPNTPMAGRSDTRGFWLLGEVPTDAVQEAATEALARMKAGEYHLAVHPHCGTNYVISGTIAGLAGASAMSGVGPRFRDKLDRIPLAASLATLALITSQPLALMFQARLTTSGEPGDLEVIQVIPTRRGGIMAHHIVTQG